VGGGSVGANIQFLICAVRFWFFLFLLFKPLKQIAFTNTIKGSDRMYRNIITALALTTLVSACDVAPSTDTQTRAAMPAANEPAQPKASIAARTLEGVLKKDMAYVDLRNAALAEGWLPLVDPLCKENVGGEAAICDQLAELESCSGDGRCLMQFAHGPDQSMLKVDAYGDYSKWSLSGESAVLNVRGWEFSSAEAADVTAQCPSQDFADFLNAFAGDDSVQKAFTLSLVKVMRYRDVGEDYETYPSYMSAADYSGFRIDRGADGFHIVDSTGKADPKPTPLEIKPEGEGSYYVSYRYGMSEGNSYRFQHRRGCWYLAEDPDAPSP
jgi:hypothetical protein